MFLLRKPILALSASTSVRDAITTLPVTRGVVDRFVAGSAVGDAVSAVRVLRESGLRVTLDHLGEGTAVRAQADAAAAAYSALIAALNAAGLAEDAEVSVKLSAVGALLPASADVPDGGEAYALAGAGRIVHAAYDVGARVTLDMEDHTATDATLRTLTSLRAHHPDVGVALQAMLHRTESDLRGLVGTGSRVRLVKGAYNEPSEVAYADPAGIDLAYVRCLKLLMAGDGYPMVGSHDPRLIAIAGRLALRAHRGPTDYEHQMLYGIRPDEQRRLAAQGRVVRIYLPYGTDWYGYFTRRLAEKPGNLLFFLRAMASRG